MKSRGREGVRVRKIWKKYRLFVHIKIYSENRGEPCLFGALWLPFFLSLSSFICLSIYMFMNSSLWGKHYGSALVELFLFFGINEHHLRLSLFGWCPKPFHFTSWIEPQSKMVTHSTQGTLWTGVNTILTSNYPGRLRNGFNEVSVPVINNSRANPEISKGKASHLIITGSC